MSDRPAPPSQGNVEPDSTKNDRLGFWLSCAAIGTVTLFVGAGLVISSFFVYSDVQADGYAAGRLLADLASGFFWALLYLVGTFYISIPVATLVCAMVRRLLARYRAPHP